MVLLDDDELDRPLRAAAPVGPPLRGAVLRVEEGRQALLHRGRRHRVRQPLHLRRGRLELRAVARSAPRSAWCSCASSPLNLARRQRNFDLLSAFFGTYPDVFVLPRQTAGARDRVAHVPGPDPARVRDPPGRVPGAHGGPRRRHAHGVDRQRHRGSRRSRTCRTGSPAGGLPNADRVMEQGLILPLNHGLDDDDIEYLCVTAGRFLQEHGYAPAGVASCVSGRFAGRRAIVTGASRGIGAGIAERLAAEGAAVAIVARTRSTGDRANLPGSLQETAARLRGVRQPGRDRRRRPHRRRRPRPHRARGRGAARRADRHPRQQRGRGDVRAAVGDAVEAPTHHLRGERARAARPRAGRAPGDARARARAGSSTCRAPPASSPPGRRSSIGGLGATTGMYGSSKAALNRETNALGARAVGPGHPRQHRRAARRGDERGRRDRSPVT